MKLTTIKSPIHVFNLVIKILLWLSFIVILFFQPDTITGKGMPLRAPFFLGASLFLPLWFRSIKNKVSYPYLADICLTLALLIDTLGNLFGWFDSIRIYDDVVHAINWMLLVIAFLDLYPQASNTKTTRFLLGMGMGATLIIVWELCEWLVSIDGLNLVSSLHLSYNDTIGDLFMSSLGGTTGSLLSLIFSRNVKD